MQTRCLIALYGRPLRIETILFVRIYFMTNKIHYVKKKYRFNLSPSAHRLCRWFRSYFCHEYSVCYGGDDTNTNRWHDGANHHWLLTLVDDLTWAEQLQRSSCRCCRRRRCRCRCYNHHTTIARAIDILIKLTGRGGRRHWCSRRSNRWTCSGTCVESGGVGTWDTRCRHTRIGSRRRWNRCGDVGNDGGGARCTHTSQISKRNAVENSEWPEVGIENGLRLWSTKLGSSDHTAKNSHIFTTLSLECNTHLSNKI